MAKKELEFLVKAGAFDCLGINRGSLFQVIPSEIKRAGNWKDMSAKGTWSIFPDMNAADDDVIQPLSTYPEVEWEKSRYQEGEDESD